MDSTNSQTDQKPHIAQQAYSKDAPCATLEMMAKLVATKQSLHEISSEISFAREEPTTGTPHSALHIWWMKHASYLKVHIHTRGIYTGAAPCSSRSLTKQADGMVTE